MKTFFQKTLSGMATGLFATLIVGVIFGQFASVFENRFGELLNTVSMTLKSLMGLGIGLGIALSTKQSGLKLISVAITGAISTCFKAVFDSDLIIFGLNNDPVTSFFVVIISLLLVSLVFRKSRALDILLLPIFAVIISGILTFLIGAPIGFVLNNIAQFISFATSMHPFLMSITIAVVMGMLLTAPISSAAIAISINLSGIAAGAAVIGCCVQMVGFAIQSLYDNKKGTFFSILFGTSMIQFKNIVKKPIIWLPTIIVSAVLAPIATLVFNVTSTSAGAGMGTSGLVGVLQTIENMGYSFQTFLVVILFCFILPAGLVFLTNYLFLKLKIIKKGDLALNDNL